MPVIATVVLFIRKVSIVTDPVIKNTSYKNRFVPILMSAIVSGTKKSFLQLLSNSFCTFIFCARTNMGTYVLKSMKLPKSFPVPIVPWSVILAHYRNVVISRILKERFLELTRCSFYPHPKIRKQQLRVVAVILCCLMICFLFYLDVKRSMN